MNHYFLIIDLEATCCDQRTIPRHKMEIIEIGAVLLNRQTWEIDAEFQQFIKPVINPILTEFCTNLTSITQQQVDTAPTFIEAMSNLTAWLDLFPNSDYTFCSWGNYDKTQFLQDCKFHNFPYPFGAEHRNIKQEFSEYLGVSYKFGMKKALEKIGKELKGTHHRGIDDARNIAEIYRYMHTNIQNESQ
ncbi:MAG: exonuclease domain-containing protein [Sphaerospermopsis sp. SIO1G2]|nr:exonuclease domain-containing protein [Sphaerospermopsis sp. SIO1G2]